MSEIPTIVLCGPKAAAAWCEKSWQGETDEVCHLASTLIEHAHDCFIGLTPGLASSLARLLLNPRDARERTGPWGPVLERIRDELNGTGGHQAEASLGIAFAAHPAYTVQRVALPLIEAAEHLAAASLLFAEHSDGVDFWEDDQREAHEKKLGERLAEIAATKDDGWKLFFRERALTMVALTRTSESGAKAALAPKAEVGALPDAEVGLAALLAGLVPELPHAREKNSRSRTARFPLRKKLIQRVREAGFVGVHLTRDPDLRDMLTSEFLNPDLVWLDRVLNTGYQAFEREPKREHLRHVLIACLVPADLAPAEADLARVAWYEACLRLTPRLLEAGLSRSEFRLIAADSRQRWSVGRFFVEDLPAGITLPPGEPSEGYRRVFLSRLQWIPTATEMVPLRHELQPPPVADHPLFGWLGAAWQEHQRAPGARSGDGLAAQEYSYVHVVALLPLAARPEDSLAPAVATLRRQYLKLPAEGTRHASIAWMPTAVDTTWGFEATNQPGARFDSWDPHESLAARAGRVAHACLTQWEEEIFHD